MERYERDDGRYFLMELGKDLYGHAVVIRYGGRSRPSRTRIIAVDNVIEGEKVLGKLATRRTRHGYRLIPTL